MKALVVYAHPSQTSLNYAVKESLKLGFADAGWEVIEKRPIQNGLQALSR